MPVLRKIPPSSTLGNQPCISKTSKDALTDAHINNEAGPTLRAVDPGLHVVISSVGDSDPNVEDDDVDSGKGHAFRLKNGNPEYK